MGVILKHSFKNIFSKPGRLIVLLICITFASFAALLAFDMGNNIESLMRSYAMEMVGKMDIEVENTSSDIMEGISKVADMTELGIGILEQTEYTRDPSSYTYVFEDNVKVFFFSDLNAAYEMDILPQTDEFDDGEVFISRDYSDSFEVYEGDTITLERADEEQIELTVAGILDTSNTLLSDKYVVVTNAVAEQIACVVNNDYSIWMIDVKDDSMIEAVTEALKTNDPKAEIMSISELLSMEGIEQIFYLFYLLFLVSFLLVVFVTMSFAEKIVNERMSVIGTLRSLGVRPGKTALILLLENALYAVLGAITGCLLYGWVKPVMLGSMFTVQTMNGKLDVEQYIGATPLNIYILVFIGAILIECAYPLFELLKAVKTPIRDIIFNNKDTEFKYKWTRLYIGAGLMVISAVCAFLTKNFFTLAVSFACGIVAMALLIPFFIRIISRGMTKLFNKAKWPVAALASENIARNKMIMGTAVLCITSLILSLLIGGVGKAMSDDLVIPDYDCDVLVNVYLSDDNHNYRFIKNIEGVEDVDYIYGTSLCGNVGNNTDNPHAILSVFADTPHTRLTDVPSEGFGLNENEIVLSETRARSLGLNVGDEVEVSLNTDTDFPNTMTFVVAQIIDTGNTAVLSTNTVIINADLYERLFDNALTMILIKTDDPDTVKELINKNTQTSVIEVKTMDDLVTDYKSQAEGLLMVLKLVVAGSIGLTLIGIAGNQSLGFITRRREMAMLYSVAMPRKRIRRLLFLESLFSIGLSATVASVSVLFLYQVLGNLMALLSDGDLNILRKGTIDPGTMITYLVVIVFVFLLTTLIPIRYLRKMKISEELKYE